MASICEYELPCDAGHYCPTSTMQVCIPLGTLCIVVITLVLVVIRLRARRRHAHLGVAHTTKLSSVFREVLWRSPWSDPVWRRILQPRGLLQHRMPCLPRWHDFARRLHVFRSVFRFVRQRLL
jgi:hypothetical protein